MPPCPRCSHQNKSNSPVCSGCGAQLPRLVEMAGPSLELMEGKTYLTPQQSYTTEYLFQLSEAVEGGDTEQVQLWLKLIAKNLEEFAGSALQRLRGLLDMERFADPDTDFPDQVQYLVNKGVAGYQEGLDAMRAATDQAALEAGLKQLQEGNDNLVLGLGMLSDRKAQLEQTGEP